MTTEGWVQIMSNGIDARGIDKTPEYEHNPLVAIYFVIFVILGTFLLINLFTAVITDHFNKIKASKEVGAGGVYSNKNIKLWVDVQNLAVRQRLDKRPTPPSGSENRRKVYNLCMNPVFDIIVITIIVLNTVVLAMTYARMSDSYATFIQVMNLIFVVLYNIEFGIKIFGLGLQYFTRDTWNIFDFVCVIGSDISILFDILQVQGGFQSIFIFLRAFRVLRLLRFLNTYHGSSTIITFVDAAPQIQNVLTLVILIMFIYAALGINLFGTAMYRDNYNEQSNFRNIFEAFMLLVR